MVRIASAVAVALTALLVAGCGGGGSSSGNSPGTQQSSAQPKTIRVVFDWPGIDFEAVPLTVGNARGFYKKAGLNVQIVIPPSTSTTVKMIAAGKGDIGFDTTTDVVFAQAAGIDVKSIANYSQDNN